MLITNQLSASQAADIASLEADCKKAENLMGSIFLSNELNFDPDLPCFYLLYHPEHPSTLIAFLSIFAPLPTEAEIYAYTAPSYRQKGYFCTLLRQALLVLKKYQICDLLFVYEPNARSFASVLKKIDALYQYSEYLMKRHPSHFVSRTLPTGLSLLPASKIELKQLAKLHAAAYHLSQSSSRQLLSDIFASEHTFARKLVIGNHKELVGICFFTVGKNELSILAVAVHPAHQRNGYALAMLHALFQELLAIYPQLPITLEVNSRNTAAFTLYQKLGFQIASQVDYSYIDRDQLFDKLYTTSTD